MKTQHKSKLSLYFVLHKNDKGGGKILSRHDTLDTMLIWFIENRPWVSGAVRTWEHIDVIDGAGNSISPCLRKYIQSVLDTPIEIACFGVFKNNVSCDANGVWLDTVGSLPHMNQPYSPDDVVRISKVKTEYRDKLYYELISEGKIPEIGRNNFDVVNIGGTLQLTLSVEPNLVHNSVFFKWMSDKLEPGMTQDNYRLPLTGWFIPTNVVLDINFRGKWIQ